MPPVVTPLILAATVVATVAVGVASASFIRQIDTVAAPKADRLPIAVADNAGTFVTLETRPDQGTSVLHKIQVN